ncbi:MAG TPA: membrane protein insertase YidC, partial [Xanthomonadales bacterium]|nr:membrane protein insertase YidC [Xanthomonadales bacterium]
MGNLRPVLLISLAFLGYMLWVEWQKDYHSPQPVEQSSASAGVSESAEGLPELPQSTEDLPQPRDPGQISNPDEAASSQDAAAMRAESPTVNVRTDVLDLEIDLLGGTVVSAQLLNYPVNLEKPETKVDLLHRNGDHLFIAQSGLLSHQPAPNHTTLYKSAQTSYALADGAEEIRVPLTWEDTSGIKVTKTFIFKRGRYDIEVRHQVNNGSSGAWAGSRYDQLQKSVVEGEQDRSFTDPNTYSFT